jgi:hypothetical protein
MADRSLAINYRGDYSIMQVQEEKIYISISIGFWGIYLSILTG